jgi:Domain of unknown function (DUF1992)
VSASDRRLSPIRRDADGNQTAGRSWESLTERLIREAQEAGEFEQLPHRGKPLPDRSNPYAGEMGLAFDILQNAGAAPPWIEADKEARAWLDRRKALIGRVAGAGSAVQAMHLREMTAIVLGYNRAAARVNAEAPTPRQHRQPLDLKRELAALRAVAAVSERP